MLQALAGATELAKWDAKIVEKRRELLLLSREYVTLSTPHRSAHELNVMWKQLYCPAGLSCGLTHWTAIKQCCE